MGHGGRRENYSFNAGEAAESEHIYTRFIEGESFRLNINKRFGPMLAKLADQTFCNGNFF